MTTASYALLSMMAFSFLFADAGFADQSGQNSSNGSSPSAGSTNNNASAPTTGNASPQSSSTPANAQNNNTPTTNTGKVSPSRSLSRNSQKATGTIGASRHGSGTLGGPSTKMVNINGTTIHPKHYLSQ